MYKVLLIEDEKPAAEWLQQLILKFDPQISILAVIDSVRGAGNGLASILLLIWFLWTFNWRMDLASKSLNG